MTSQTLLSNRTYPLPGGPRLKYDHFWVPFWVTFELFWLFTAYFATKSWDL